MPRIESIQPRKQRGETIRCTLCKKECIKPRRNAINGVYYCTKHGQAFQRYLKRWITAQSAMLSCVKKYPSILSLLNTPYPFLQVT